MLLGKREQVACRFRREVPVVRIQLGQQFRRHAFPGGIPVHVLCGLLSQSRFSTWPGRTVSVNVSPGSRLQVKIQPPAVRLCSRAEGWRAEQVDEWIASRERARGDSASRGPRRE